MAGRVAERTYRIGRPLFSPRNLWVAAWGTACIVNGAILLASRRIDEPSLAAGSVAVVLQLLATAGLLCWFGRTPVEGLAAAPVTRRGALIVAVGLSVVVLFSIGAAGLVVLIPVGVAAAVVLLVLHPHMSRREIGWAAVLGGLAAGGGLVEWLGSGRVQDLGVGLAQVPLVLVTLLAGWELARRMGWWDQARIGLTVYPSQGATSALREIGFGFAVALPWAFGNIATGPFEEDDYFRAGWQVLAALHPGVAEEAWSRVFIIALLYWVFRRYARARTAVLTAALLGTYWFAFLHAPFNPVTVVLLATIQVLPLTFLWLRRSLEAAIGFHVCVDLVRFFAAYLAYQGIWFI